MPGIVRRKSNSSSTKDGVKPMSPSKLQVKGVPPLQDAASPTKPLGIAGAGSPAGSPELGTGLGTGRGGKANSFRRTMSFTNLGQSADSHLENTTRLKRVASRIHDAKAMDKALNSSRLKNMLLDKMADQNGTGKQRARKRRPSVDLGPPDWPEDSDIQREAPPMRRGNFSQLVEEIRDLEVCYAVRPIDPPPLRPGEKAPPPGMEVLKVHLPNATELQTFPEALAAHLKDVGIDTLKVFLHPVLLFRQRLMWRKRLATERQSIPARVPVDFLAKVPLFRQWPPDALEKITKAMTLRSYEPREFVVYERELASAIFFLATGSVEMMNRAESKKIKTHTRGNILNRTIHSSVSVFGELSLLTDEPWQYSLRTNSKADFWVLTKPEFQKVFRTIPQHLIQSSIRTAFQRRNDTMRSNFPMDASAVRVGILSNVSHEFATEISERLEPYAVPRDYVLSREDDEANAMFFLRFGAVKISRTIEGKEFTLSNITTQGVIGEVALAHGSTNDYTYRTTTESDLYRLTKAAFVAISRSYPHDVAAMLDAARSQREAELHSNQTRFADLVRSIPVIRDVLPSYYIKDFVKLLHPRSVRPLSSLCSVSSFCDRIIILTKGVVRVGRSGILKAGECVGFTCCVPHRWGQNALTVDATAEVLEIDCQRLMAWLDEHNLLAEMIHRSKVIMFPHAFPVPEAQRIAQTVPRDLPLMYPISLSRRVNLNEIGFCTVHMPLLTEIQREEQAKKDQMKADTPESYKQLSQGVWIPMNRQIRGFTTAK